MQLPKEVMIFGRTYDVQDLCPIHVSEGVLGLAAYRDGVIYLDQSVDMALSLSTLWHEAIHVAQQEIFGNIDESQARWMSLFVHNFLVHNPEVLEFYMHGLSLGSFEDDEGKAG
ncbi:MAG: hypothetical protein HY913_18965 [Desulfomonile tiedjei]|nr:hypothetical protein [Desulfomonile tiedjei]